uniref:Putative conserved plasma membrane protein n=1 Tax=Tabanus bromius TaxID=304241 RepID=A0A0K8TMM8_TABBR
MSTVVDDRNLYLQNPFFKKHVYGDYTPFYTTVIICTVVGVFLILFNVICCCCSKYKDYWQDRHTGNRWLVSIWSSTPHKQPPLDLKELKDPSEFQNVHHYVEVEQPENISSHHHLTQFEEGPARTHFPRHHHHRREEFVELKQQKRESDI